ncbi:hypothetical protein GT347_02325 [Xylophilus rhododendri]|uniref:Uncharacterized protein n=1 Tax=Xylophilus rhododendri TaxID=2697032 RepID=A0A857IZA4_9BURK|nr:hypothetical protein [Xylophilus rhododendri]QHI96924.1 hypothetical protein GT347_02325 [Xylophilus rhododendri]
MHAYAQATGGDLLTWEPQKILSWVRKELAQVRAQADDDQRETRIREAFDAGKNSQIARSRTHGIVSPIYAYPNMEDVNKFAPCGIPVLRFQWVDPDVPSYSLIFGPPDPALCRGNAETDIAYKLARQIAHGPRNQLFKPDNAKYLPRNMAVQVSRTEVSQNCGPDNLVIKKIPALSPLIRFDLCPPYVSPYHRWRESMKNSLVTDYEAKRKREFFDPQPQQQFSPPQRPFVGQPGFDNQRKQFDGQAFNQAGRQQQDG